jgi:CRISPR-associated protein Cas1
MLRRTVEISREPIHLCVRHSQLVLKRGEEIAGSIPCEDVGMVVVDHPQASYTQAALASLIEAGAVLVVCDRAHLPSGLLLPLANHSEVVWRIREQLDAPLPRKKRIWQQIVQGKILAQAANLAAGSATRERLKRMAAEVKSGDAGAHESQAAKLYWQTWLIEAPEDEWPEYLREGEGWEEPETAARAWHPEDEDTLRSFRRDVDGDGLNALLNYGYAIVRAAVARAIVAAGLHPALGIQHRHRSNAFCLADDLMEPLRPMVDRRARQLWWSGSRELDQATKAELLEVLTEDVAMGNERGPLQVALHRYTASFVRCLRKEEGKLAIPRAQAQVGTP